LIAEENVNQHFTGHLERAGKERAALERFGFVPKYRRTSWHTLDPRFDFDQEPHEPNRFGWIVELDPHHPDRPPVKRTALGRFKHECATCVLAPSGQVVIYSADDHVDEFLYRFISKHRYDPKVRENNWGLLDQGTLQVAQLSEAGHLRWLNLTYGEGPLTPDHGFNHQGDVVIETRRAASLLGATPLDRPEGVAVDQERGLVYVMLTQHKDRASAQPWSPRAPNNYGHALTLSLTGSDHSASTGTWSVLFLGGPPQEGGSWPSPGWIKNPDNAALGPQGDLWVAADSHSTDDTGFDNGLWRCSLQGERAGIAERFCTVPVGAEPCGVSFSDDGRSLFFCVQHPGEGSSWAHPSTRWPEFRNDRPPRPSLVVVERDDGAVI
jgi:secreted PhoX family phosphatase